MTPAGFGHVSRKKLDVLRKQLWRNKPSIDKSSYFKRALSSLHKYGYWKYNPKAKLSTSSEDVKKLFHAVCENNENLKMLQKKSGVKKGAGLLLLPAELYCIFKTRVY